MHDGDVLSVIYLYTEETVKEIDDFLDSKNSLIDASGKLIYDISPEVVERAFAAISGEPTFKRE